MELLKSKKKKNKEEKKEKVCRICNTPILDKEDYCALDTFNEGEFQSRGYYHILCFREKILKKDKIGKSLQKSNEMIEKITRRFFGE